MATNCWRGPDVLVVGWIPFSMTAPPGYPAGVGATLLFQSGNPLPPVDFVDHAGFLDWPHPVNIAGTKQYRAALYLKDVVAEFPSGSASTAKASDSTIIGYTPLRTYFGGVNVAGMLPQISGYSRGTGPYSPPTKHSDPAGDWVEIKYRAEFKVSHLPNLIARMLTGAWAPYAWCEITYRVYKTGRVEVGVDGSAIPSQRLYIDWSRPAPAPAQGIHPEYDMRTATQAEVVGFIKTMGWGCNPGPGGPRLTWHGQAASCYVEADAGALEEEES